MISGNHDTQSPHGWYSGMDSAVCSAGVCALQALLEDPVFAPDGVSFEVPEQDVIDGAARETAAPIPWTLSQGRPDQVDEEALESFPASEASSETLGRDLDH